MVSNSDKFSSQPSTLHPAAMNVSFVVSVSPQLWGVVISVIVIVDADKLKQWSVLSNYFYNY